MRVDNFMQTIEAGALYFALVFAEHGAPQKRDDAPEHRDGERLQLPEL